MKKIGKLISILFCLIFSSLGLAQSGAAVNATVDRNKMAQGDSFTLSISVQSGQSVSVQEPKLPALVGLELLNSWQGSETRSTYENGKFQVQQTKTFNYLLAPSKKGQLQIGSINVQVNGKSLATQPITITVLAGGSSPQPKHKQKQKPTQAVDPFSQAEEMFSQLLKRRNTPQKVPDPVDPNQAFFIHAEVDKESAYIGEQITASWYLYTRGQIRDIDTLKYPSLNGFWKEEIELATRLTFKQVVVNGIPYKRARLASFALFPIKKGRATIDPYKARCTVLSGRFGGFGRPYKYTRSSKPIRVDVKELPLANQPADFSGAVGKFEVTAKLDENSVPVNQPVTLKVRFEGRGNAKLIDLPPLNLPESIELYDTKKTSKYYKNGKSFKEFEVLLIPRRAGQVPIPGLSVSAFDPDTQQYYTKTTSEMILQINENANAIEIEGSPLTHNLDKDKRQEEKLPGLSLAWEDEASFLKTKSPIIWLIVYVFVFGFLGWRFYVEFGFGQRKKDLDKIISSRIQKMNQLIEKGAWRQFGVESTNLVYMIFGELSGSGGAYLPIEKLMKYVPPSVRRELEQPFAKLLAKLEALSFAPDEMIGSLKEKGELKKTLNETQKLLTKAVQIGIKDEELSDNAGVQV